MHRFFPKQHKKNAKGKANNVTQNAQKQSHSSTTFVLPILPHLGHLTTFYSSFGSLYPFLYLSLELWE